MSMATSPPPPRPPPRCSGADGPAGAHCASAAPLLLVSGSTAPPPLLPAAAAPAAPSSSASISSTSARLVPMALTTQGVAKMMASSQPAHGRETGLELCSAAGIHAQLARMRVVSAIRTADDVADVVHLRSGQPASEQAVSAAPAALMHPCCRCWRSPNPPSATRARRPRSE